MNQLRDERFYYAADITAQYYSIFKLDLNPFAKRYISEKLMEKKILNYLVK